MQSVLYFLVIMIFLNSCQDSGKNLLEIRDGYTTDIMYQYNNNEKTEVPPADLFKLITYPSEVGELDAYLSIPTKPQEKLPAIIWIFGGFENSIGATAWEKAPRNNDQSARAFRENGMIMMYPSLRGGNTNPGYVEGFYGEVNDVIAAYEYLSKLSFVDKDEIYLGGHSTGGTLALLVAEATDKFKAVFALGPVGDVEGYGDDNFAFNTERRKEWKLRSPIHFLSLIKTQTYVFEGTNGNLYSLHNLSSKNSNPYVEFYELKDKDHFDIIAPLTEMLSKQIMSPWPGITIASDDLNFKSIK